ncbi:MAG: ArgE/DapE family deacylase [Desulfovermiculus sp.]|nr:ArgE/DapE family deacylase [Desulfovermiculus sp.]
MDTQQEKIVQIVDGLEQEIYDFTARLTAEASTLGNEAGAIQVMHSELDKLGFAPKRIPIDPGKLCEHPGFAPVPWDYAGKECVVGFYSGCSGQGKSLIFNGHLDVVSAEPIDFWVNDPFVPYVQDGWMYGRGSGDMKSGVAAMTYAAFALGQAGFGLKGNLTLEGVIEEECTGNGALACMQAGYDADAVLIPEPFGMTVLTNQVGVLWFKVKIKGEPKHVLEAPIGTNAIEKSYGLIKALRELEQEMNEGPFPGPYKEMQHPLNLNVGIFKGGDWPSTVPAESEVHCRLSYFPGSSFAEIASKVQDKVAKASKQDDWLSENEPQVEFYAFRSDGHSVDPGLPAFNLLRDCHYELTGQKPKDYIATCTTDLRTFQHFGTPQSTCYGPVAENIHGIDERVKLDSILHTAKAYALFAAKWCELTE